MGQDVVHIISFLSLGPPNTAIAGAFSIPKVLQKGNSSLEHQSHFKNPQIKWLASSSDLPILVPLVSRRGLLQKSFRDNGVSNSQASQTVVLLDPSCRRALPAHLPSLRQVVSTGPMCFNSYGFTWEGAPSMLGEAHKGKPGKWRKSKAPQVRHNGSRLDLTQVLLLL